MASEKESGRRQASRLAPWISASAGKVALVTGSSRGIGRGIATRLVEEGADVVFCARGEEALEEAVSGGRRARAGPQAWSPTSRRPMEPRPWSPAPSSAFGGLDVVVNNVGGSGARTIDEMDTRDLEDVLGKNLLPALARLTRRAARTCGSAAAA